MEKYTMFQDKKIYYRQDVNASKFICKLKVIPIKISTLCLCVLGEEWLVIISNILKIMI